MRQPRQRHRAQPRADRARRRSPRWSPCSTSRSRCSTRRRRSPTRAHDRRAPRRMSSALRAHRLRDAVRRQVLRVRQRRLPPRGRRGGRSARSSSHTGRGRRSSSLDDEAAVARAPAARGDRRAGPARDPRRQARRGGRGAARDGQARAGRGDRQAGRRLGRRSAPSTPRRASPTSRSTCSSPPASPTSTSAPRSTRTSASTSRCARSPSSTRLIAETTDSKTIIGLCATAGAARRRGRLRPRHGPLRRLHRQGRAMAGARMMEPMAVAASDPAVRAPRARLPRLPRVRARALAQHARGLPLRPAAVRRVPGNGRDALAVAHSDLAGFVASLAAGDGDRPPVAPATLQRKVACLRSFYRHLRRQGDARGRPDRAPARAAPEPPAPAGALARRGRQPARAARAAPSRRRCATARCWSSCTPAACARRRRSGLEVGDVDLEAGILRARGKGSKERLVPDRLDRRPRARRSTCSAAARSSSATGSSRACSSTTAAPG